MKCRAGTGRVFPGLRERGTVRRADYIRRRMATGEGRRNIRRWAAAVLYLLLLAGGAAVAVASGWAATSAEDVWQAWDALRSGRVTADVLPPIVSAALLLAAPSGLAAGKAAWALRPWRPHSGGAHLAAPAAPAFTRIRTGQAAYQEILQQIQLNETTRAPAPHSAPDGAGPGAGDGQPAPGRPVAVLTLGEVIPPGMLLFRLLGRMEELNPRQYNTLAFMLYNDRRVHKKEIASCLHVNDDQPSKAVEAIRSRLNRMPPGWAEPDDRADGYWMIPDTVHTDLDLLFEATERNNETLASALAAAAGPPMPMLEETDPETNWAHHRLLRGSNIKDELLARASDAIDTATEKWPSNPVFPQASDRLYGDPI